MKRVKTTTTIVGVFILLFYFGSLSGICQDPVKPVSSQTGSKSTQTVTKPKPPVSKSTQTVAKPKPPASKSTVPSAASAQIKKPIDPGTVMIGNQAWAVKNLNVSTFRNGDTIPEARTNEEWVTAGREGKPAWCYFNNDTLKGQKYGKLYNWYAVNDPRELAPAGWEISSAEDWTKLANALGGTAGAGTKMKSISGWLEGNNGNNDSGFNGLPGGYRIENGLFKNFGSTSIWWSSTESNSLNAFDHYLMFSGSLGRSSSPKQRGESVRCIKR